MQTFTSAQTSINRSKLPAVYRRATFRSGTVLDYGCGKYVDHIRSFLRSQGCVLLPYDPFNQPEEVNNAAKQYVRRASAERTPVDVVCSNVLNVIDDDGTVKFVTDQLETIAERTGGTVYITVYEGDRSGIGRQTGADQYQRNEPLRSYLRFFRNGKLRNGMIVVEQ